MVKNKDARMAEILIVEDEDDFRTMLTIELGTLYHIREACNGIEALDMLNESLPDLVLADIMMPEMDGLELCRRIKESDDFFHIPVVLLTARGSQLHQLEGLETGADVYITKPCMPALLKVQIEKRIEWRRRLREHYMMRAEGVIANSKPESLEDRFLKQAITVVEKHLSDEDFNVDQFADAMIMSRKTLYRKLKVAVEEPPMIFVRTQRLQHAKKLMLARTGTVSEISYQVGFSDVSYFTKCFRDQYGQTPSEYAE